MKPRKAFLASPFSLVLIFFLLITISLYVEKASSDEEQHVMAPHVGPLVEKGQRRTLSVTEYGEISATDVTGGNGAPFHHLQFITLDPNSVFLPVLLHADMVFYVHTGSGRLSWANEDRSGRISLREGDLCRLSEGSVFYIQSNLEAERKKLRIYALFANTDDNTYDPLIGAYSRINDLVKGFDRRILQAAFKVPEDVVDAITSKTDTPAIVHAAPEEEHHRFWELEASVLRNFIGIPTNTKKVKTYNIHENDPDFKNSHGWSLTVTNKQLKTLKDTDIGFLMVNLTRASMLGPHWNPRATEIAVVLQGEGMVRVICGSSSNDDNDNTEECQNKRLRVKEGDVFVVPRFHPMAHMSFNNDSLVFMGFSTASKENYPQFLAGKTSVLQLLDKEVMAMSLGVSNTTIDQLLGSQNESTIFGCVSCAEEEEKIMEEEIEERRREEEEKRREEDERKREEEEAKRQQEEAVKEMERRKREEEAAAAAARREQEEAKREQEKRERERQEWEEQARKEQERRKQEEEARREIEKRRQEEAAQRELERRWQEAEAAAREQEKAIREQEKRREEEKAKKEEEQGRKEQERRKQEEEARTEIEKRRQEEAARRELERRWQEAEAAAREQEKATREQEKRRREEEKAKKEQERAREEEEEEKAIREQEQARRQQEWWGKRRQEEEERARQEQQQGDEAASQWEWEQAEARRQHEGDNHKLMPTQVKEAKGFEGRRVLKKMQKD